MSGSRTWCTAMLAAFTALIALLLPSLAAAAPVTTTPVIRAAAAGAAKKKVGAPYVRGAAGPLRFDCSGLVDFAYRVAKKPLGVRSSFDMAKLGAGIRRTAIRPGDLVFTWDKRFGHVGIATSATTYVHAPAPGRKVIVAPIPAGGGLIAVRRP